MFPGKDEVIKNFEKLRQAQKQLYAELLNVEVQLQEYKIYQNRMEVLKTLRSSDPAQKCFRLQSDVLVEKTVKDVFPAVVLEKEKMEKTLEELRVAIQEKSRVVQEYQSHHRIRVLLEQQA
ncbi:uncharacterized protein CEXT_671621 [Caerostris extrusa]|uniref:Prefoldin subunit 6 n=1 Tax=Caerostris extrusa TaxID=172846 RepID=A0AAV4X879_CAEEX|nr:uncharacterized protein CEXT_671621 [Caerostris extrusa]